MAPAVAEMGLDLKLCAMRTVGGFLEEASASASATATGDGGRAARLEESIRTLEEEKRKIEAFKRELPLCMQLLSQVIEGLNEEIERCRGDGRLGRVFEEFIPAKSKVEEDGGFKDEADCQDKMNWMSSAQLWSDNYSNKNNDDERNCDKKDGGDHRSQRKDNFFLECKTQNGGGAFLPFKGRTSISASSSKEEERPAVVLPDLSLQSPAIKTILVTKDMASKAVGKALESSPVTSTHLSLQSQQQQALRKARRCWSKELHRRFVFAIQQLGGSQVATPKQIREQMKVDGLTNDEVKSHLQKYRLHTRKVSNTSAAASRPGVVGGLWVPQEQYTSSSQQSLSLSGSPQSPLHLAGSAQAVSFTAEDSSEEDDKSESYSWK